MKRDVLRCWFLETNSGVKEARTRWSGACIIITKPQWKNKPTIEYSLTSQVVVYVLYHTIRYAILTILMMATVLQTYASQLPAYSVLSPPVNENFSQAQRYASWESEGVSHALSRREKSR